MAPISLKKGKIDAISEELVEAVAGLEKGTENFKIALEFTLSNFRFNKFLDVNSFDVTRKFDGLKDKFLVHCKENSAIQLKALKEKYLQQPFSISLFEERTEYHYGMLSLLLNISQSPLKRPDFLPKDEIAHEEEVQFDWTKFLLDGEEELSLGIDISEQQRRKLEDDDDDDDDDEEFVTGQYGSDNQAFENHRTEGQVNEIDTFQEYHSYGYEQSDLKWLHQHIVPQYWKDEPNYMPILQKSNSDMVSTIIVPFEENRQGCHLTEGIVIRETIWMLQGIAKTYIYSFMNGKYAVRDDVTLGHMSREILYNVTAEFAESGNKIQELKEFVTTVPNVGKGQLRTERSFGFAVNSFLRGVRKELASLEHDIVSKGKLRTILEFKLEMKYLFSNVDLVYDVHKACITAIENGPLPPNDRVVHILETLFTTVCRLDASGHAGAPQVSVMLPILLETLRPLLNDLASWITHGRLPPTGSDQFFVYEDENLSQEDSEAWKNRFRLRHRWDDEKRLAVPQFLEEMAGKVLLTGKSCRILDQAVNNVAEQRTSDFEEEFFENLFDGLGMSWEKDAAKQTVEYADDFVLSKELSFSECKTHRLLVENFVVVFQRNFERFTRGVGDVSNHSNFIQKFIQQREVQLAERNSCGNPFRLTFNSSLHLLINSRYTQASRALLDLLTVRFRFDDNFNTLKNFFLMGAGDVLNEFYSEIFAKIRVKEYWQSTSYLTSVLQDALQTRFPHLVNKLTVGIQTDPRAVSNANPSSIQSVNVIYLRYSMKWPLNIIFDSKAEEKYNEVFSFLLQVKRAMWSLEQLRINDLGKETNNSQKQSNPVDYSRQQQSPAISRQKMFFLRMRLLHFVHSFHTYIMTRILHSSGLEFKAKLSEAKDFEEILMFHQEFLENVHDRCLLSPKVGFAKEAITRILNLSLNFQRHWDLGLENIRHDDLQAIGTEFDKCSHFIQSFLNNLIKRGSFPHLELLSLSLEM